MLGLAEVEAGPGQHELERVDEVDPVEGHADAVGAVHRVHDRLPGHAEERGVDEAYEVVERHRGRERDQLVRGDVGDGAAAHGRRHALGEGLGGRARSEDG